MGLGFGWQDFVGLLGALYGSYESAKTIPNFPADNGFVRYTRGLHISLIILIWGAVSYPKAEWLNSLDSFMLIKMPFNTSLLGYVIVAFGLFFFINSIMQTILIKYSAQKYLLNLISVFWIIFDISLTVHLMSLF